jgi:hypothetical protein
MALKTKPTLGTDKANVKTNEIDVKIIYKIGTFYPNFLPIAS